MHFGGEDKTAAFSACYSLMEKPVEKSIRWKKKSSGKFSGAMRGGACVFRARGDFFRDARGTGRERIRGKERGGGGVVLAGEKENATVAKSLLIMWGGRGGVGSGKKKGLCRETLLKSAKVQWGEFKKEGYNLGVVRHERG